MAYQIKPNKDLATAHPNIAAEWHPSRNGILTPSGITYSSKEKVWWLGKDCGHEWEAPIHNRCLTNGGCLVCSGRRVLIGFNDLVTKEPEIAAEWHPTKNEDLKNTDVTPGSNKTVWWQGTCGHEWQAKILTRTSAHTRCRICFGRTTLTGANDLATLFPDIASEWHPTKNTKHDILTIPAGSNQKVWWLGRCGHEWEAVLQSRTGKSQYGCPVCSSRTLLAGFNDLESQFPQIASEWHPTKNGSLKPSECMKHANKNVWWQCSNNHEWEANIANRSFQKHGCPYCSGQRIIPGETDLLTMNPLLASQWHPTKNGELTAEQVKLKSNKQVWWVGTCGHEWKASLASRTRGEINYYCSTCVKSRIEPGITDLLTLNPKLASEWHPDNSLLPSQVSIGSEYKAKWICNLGHEWIAPVTNRSKGYGCPTCGNKRVLPGFNDLASLQPELSKEWHSSKNGDLKPNAVTIGSGRKVWWICAKEHEWEARISERATRYKTGCPECNAKNYISKAEQAIADYLVAQGVDAKQTNREILKGSELDIYIPSLKVAIEYNGLFYHTEFTGKHQTYHYDKWLQCKQAGVQLIQIWEDDWNRNEDLIKKMLLHKLGVSNDRKVFARKTVVTNVSTKDAKDFLTKHHIQGYASGSYYLGLVEKTISTVENAGTDTLLALMVLKKEQGKLNLVRYATSCTVVGGFTKLLKHVERNLEYTSLYTFSDNCISDGGLYEHNGFIADKDLPPDYKYLVGGELKHKFGYRLKRFRDDPSLLWEESLTERELASLNGLERVWDAGKTRWSKVK